MSFTLYESIDFLNKPDLSAYGMERVYVTGNEFWAGTYPNYDKTVPDETATRALARKVAALGQILVIDIEHWPSDIRTSTDADVQTTIDKFTRIIDWVRDEEPSLQVGIYGLMPIRDYYAPSQYLMAVEKAPSSAWWAANLEKFRLAYVAWQGANDRLASLAVKVDFIFPSLYTFSSDQGGWKKYAIGMIDEGKRYNKPVTPFLWTEYHNSNKELIGQSLPNDFLALELNTVKENTTSAIIWAGWRYTTDGKLYRAQWNESDGWWTTTKTFIQNLSTELPKVAKIHVVSYVTSAESSIVSVIRADYRYPDASDQPYSIAGVVNALSTAPEGKRWVYIHALGQDGELYKLTDTTDYPTMVRRGGYYIPVMNYCERLFTAIVDAGIDLTYSNDGIILDYERKPSLYDFGTAPGAGWVAGMQRIYNNAAAKRALGEDVTKFPPEAWSAWQYQGYGSEPYTSMMVWSDAFMVKMLKRCVYDVASSVFGHSMNVANFGDYRLGDENCFPPAESNPGTEAWAPIANYGTRANCTKWGNASICMHSAPNCYLSTSNSGVFTAPYTTKHSLWNSFIYHLNYVRMIANYTKNTSRIRPWISYPTYAGDGQTRVNPWMWTEFVKHMVKMGITHFNLWNEDTTGDATVAATITECESIKQEKRPAFGWGYIAYDSDRVVTGDLVTDYSNFIV